MEPIRVSIVSVYMRMHWVVEDYAALARIVDAGTRWRENELALSPGKLILRLRRGLQISQLQLAQRAGVPRSLVGRVERGGDAQFGSLRRILAALGCEPVLLPMSKAMLAHFKAKAVEQRRRDREWEQVKRELRTD